MAGVVAILWPGLVRGETPLLRDLFLFFHPWTDYLVRRVHAGELPLWNPLEFCGTSWAGAIAGRLYNPVFPLYLLAPYRIGVLLDLLIQLGLGALFTVLLLRRLGVGTPGATLGATVSVLNAWVVAKMEAPGKIGVCALFPLALLTAVWACEGRRRRAAVAMALAVGFQILSGYPPIAAYFIATELLASTLLVLGCSGFDRRSIRRRLWPLGAGAGLGVLLSAVALVPFLEEAPRTAYWKPLPLEAAAARSLHPLHLLGLALPRVVGLPGNDCYWGGELQDFGSGALYVGLPILACAVLALLTAGRALIAGLRSQRAGSEPAIPDGLARMRAWATVALLLCALIALLVALGRHGFLFALLRKIPLFARTRWPTQSLGLIPASVGLLAGLGLDAIARGALSPRVRRLMAGVLAGAAALAFLCVIIPGPGLALREQLECLAAPHEIEILRSLGPTFLRADLARVGVIGLIAAIALAIPARFLIILPALVTADLALFGRDLVPFAPGDLFAERARLGALANVRESADRILHLPGGSALAGSISGARDPQAFRDARRALQGATHLFFDLPAADGANPVRSARNAYLVGALARSKTPDDFRWRIGAILGVSEFIEPIVPGTTTLASAASAPDTIPHRPNPIHPVPFARLVGRELVVRDDDEQIARMARTDFDPRREAIVPELLPGFVLVGGGGDVR